MKPGIELIAEERAAQVSREGWTPEHDDEHDHFEMAAAAGCYAFLAAHQLRADHLPNHWPWDAKWWKPKDQISNLVRAGALIAAEIDRLQRLLPKSGRTE